MHACKVINITTGWSGPPRFPRLCERPTCTCTCQYNGQYYLRAVKHHQSLAYSPRLAVDLGSYVDGEAHGWARQPYGYFDPAPRPRDIIHTYSYVPTAPSGAPHERVKAR